MTAMAKCAALLLALAATTARAFEIPAGTPVVTIQDVQSPPAGCVGTCKDHTKYKDQVIALYGVITAAFSNKDDKATWAFVQNGTDLRAGVMLYSPKWTNGKCEVGDQVVLYGEASEYDSATQIKEASVFKLSDTKAPIEPVTVTTKELQRKADGSEPYEGMLVTINGLTVVNANPDGPNKNYGDFVVTDSAGNEIQVRGDVYHAGKGLLDGDTPLGSTFESITGVVHYHYATYKIMMRDTNDFKGYKKAEVEKTTTQDPLKNAFEITISEMQKPTSKSIEKGGGSIDDSPHINKAVTYYGIVTADFGGSAEKSTWSFVQNGTEPYSGIMIYGMKPKRNIGDKIKMSGIVEEFQLANDPRGSTTQMAVHRHELISTGNPVPPYQKVTTAMLEGNVTGEPYESVLVYLEDVEIICENPDAESCSAFDRPNWGEITVTDASGGKARIDGDTYKACSETGNCITDAGASRTKGAKFSRVEGVVHYHRGFHKVLTFRKEAFQGFTNVTGTPSATPATTTASKAPASTTATTAAGSGASAPALAIGAILAFFAH